LGKAKVIKSALEAVVDSPAFKHWFGASKVANEAGQPIVMHHGSTARGLDQFDTSLVTKRGRGDEAGTYFTPDQMTASNYTRPSEGGPRGQVYSTYLSLQNPLDTTKTIAALRKKGVPFGDAKREALKALDRNVHDGIVFRGDGMNPPEYVAFKPNQIKSVDNEGTFDPMDARIRKAGGGFIGKLLSGVAREAPELSRGASSAARRATVNIGLDINGGARLTPEQALEALERIGVKPVRSFVAQSDSEPTLVVELSRAMNADEANHISTQLQQEAIAQVDETGAGDLFGPAADKWKPFNGDYFIRGDGKRLTEQIMEAGDAEAIPGGAPPDPVMDRIDEILRGLGQEKPAMAGGGVVRKIVGKLMAASDDAPAKAMRLYHGRSYKEPIQRLDPTISPDQLGIHLGDPETASKFATIRPNVKKNDAGARVIPLDVDMKNPLRLMDNHGKWRPEDVYRQLADRGLVEYDTEVSNSLRYRADGYVQDVDGSWIDSPGGDLDEGPLDAMLEIQDLIRSLGHDGVVYTNRYEMPEEALSRAMNRDPSLPKLGSISDDDFLKEFPEAVDSYIAFDRKQLKSPFGDGPGVGYADGGPVKLSDGGTPRGKAGVVYKLGAGLLDLLDFSGVAGKPKTVKIPGRGEVDAAPIGEIDEAAEAYMKKHGIPGTHRIDEYPEFDEDFAKRIANEYDGAKHAPNDPAVRRSYDALLEETMEQYRALEDTGLDVRFLKDGMGDPYAKSPAMGYADMVENNRLWVFPTEQGYGSSDALDVSSNPLLKKVGRVGDKADAVANDAFRVVHDAYGHFGPGNPFFRRQGEDRAWQHHGRMFTDDALPAMSAETRGQNSWVNSGPHAAQNRGLSGGDTIYADQKATIMPPWVYERDLGRKPKFADGGPVDDDINAYEDLKAYVAQQPADIQSMTHVGDRPMRDRKIDMPLLGGEFDLGPAPYDVAATQEGVLQGLYDMKTLPAYFTPLAPAAAAWDLGEGIASGDPLQMGMAVAGSVPGKVYKALGKAAWDGAKKAAAPAGGVATAAALTDEDAEAGVFGRLGKWGASAAGKDALNTAIKMSSRGGNEADIAALTGWFKDVDGHWKYWKTSKGGGYDARFPKGNSLPDVFSDPHLFDEYPHMKDITYRRKNDEGAHWDEGARTIVLGDTSKPGYNTPASGGKYGVMNHEIYHAKATKEGWPQGTSVDGGDQKVMQDMLRFINSKQGTPEKEIGDQLFSKNNEGSALGFARYQAEVGEALARREALMREFTPELLPGQGLASGSYLDMPRDTLFHPGEIATPDRYKRLMQLVEDRAVAADMMAAKGDVYFKKGKK